MKRSDDIASLFHKYESKKKAILQQLEGHIVLQLLWVCNISILCYESYTHLFYQLYMLFFH
jgi:hypothetical protein